jgi:hypothetical protein
MGPVLLSSAYFPPVSYFVKIIQSNQVFIEAHENYLKQTYRNRCVILSANGPINLVVPIKHGPDLKTGIEEISIIYEQDWQRLHYRAIESAYRNSPYYDFYISDLMQFFKTEYAQLLELNTQILQTIFSILNISIPILNTSEYQKDSDIIKDFRYAISPKNGSPVFNFKKYHQVFDDKYGFTPNLSILDLLFNMGPDTTEILQLHDFS